MKDKIKIAVVGLGFVGRRAHVSAFNKIPGAELVAVIDVLEAQAKKTAEKYGIKHYTSYQEAIKALDLDALVVAVPTPYHYDIALEAINNGKHVLCEMPLTPLVEQTRDLGEIAKEKGVILMPDLNFRFTPNYIKIKELLSEDSIGDPLAITFSEFIPSEDLALQWPSGSWAWNIDKSGGFPDFTLSVWSIDLFRWLLGSEIEKVEWVSNHSPMKTTDIMGYNTLGIVKLSNGVVGSFHYSASVSPEAGTSKLEIFGNSGKTLKAIWNNKVQLVGSEIEQEWVFEDKGTKVWGHYQIDEHFVNCILGEETPQVKVEDAIETQIVAQKIVESYTK